MKFIFIFLFLQSVFGADSQDVFPSVLDSVILRNVPDRVYLKVHERHQAFSGKVTKSRYNLHITGRGQTVGITYDSSRVNSRKKILITDFGMDVWTLDSAAGRVRKIAIHKKKESLNGPGPSYWDMYPVVLLNREYRVISDSILDSSTRMLRLDPGKRNLYKEIRFIVDIRDLFLKRIQCLRGTRYISIDMQFEPLTGKAGRRFPFTAILLKDRHSGDQTRLQFIKSKTLSEFPRDILDIPLVR
jgi:hypothetical protein